MFTATYYSNKVPRQSPVRSVLILDQAFARLEIGQHHFLDERVKIDIALPAE